MSGFNASANVSCWKQHVCVACECTFRYLLTRKVTAQGGTREAAMVNLQKQMAKTVSQEVDYCPCPECGVVQPDMVAARRRGRALLGLLGLIPLAIGWLLGGIYAVPIATSAIAAGCGAAGAALMLFLTNRVQPNRRPEANRVQVLKRLKDESMVIDASSGSASNVAYDGTDVSPTAWGAFGVGCVAVLAALSPWILSSISGWTVNQNWYPAVAGPGDASRYYMQGKLSSLKGMWRGSAGAKVINAADLGLANPMLTAKTKSSSWGNTISGKSPSNSNNRMYLDVNLPTDASLAGNELSMDVATDVQFPYMVGNSFQDERRQFREAAKLRLASPGAGATYVAAWRYGNILATILILASCLGLYRMQHSLIGAANPPRILPVGFDEAQEEEAFEDQPDAD